MVTWLQRIGNAVRYLYGQCCSSEPQTTITTAGDQPLGYHGVSSSTVGVSALAQHLYNFEITSLVPEGLSNHVISSRKAQIKWYRKLSKAWRESKPPPNTPQEASTLVINTLHGHQTLDIQGLLSFYGLPLPHLLAEDEDETPSLSKGFKFELNTLPVDARSVPDGDGVNVYVSASDTRESSRVPQDVIMAAVERHEARAQRNYTRADALNKQITDAGYGVLQVDNQEILARKYRIRLRGIDAPENAQPFGKEAKDELVKIVEGNSLKILIFDEDQYGRFVGDVYCNGIFVQKRMLKKGLAWHYVAYDKRPQLAKWENDAKAKGIGLWASSDPEMPWEWRKNHRHHRY